MSVLIAWQPASGQAADQHPLQYSVLVASVTSLEDARDLQQQWTTPETPFYIVPLRVNRQVYFRVMAGMLGDRGEAVDLMNDLVARGAKDTSGAWHVRNTEMAFRLGSHGSLAESERDVARATAEGIPAYTIVVSSAQGPRYDVFVGGFENTTEAEFLQGWLAARGAGTDLIRRVGALPPARGALGQGAEVVVEPPPANREPDPTPVREAEVRPQADSLPAPTQAVEAGAGEVEEAEAAREEVVEEAPVPTREVTPQPAPGVVSGALPPRPLPQMPSQARNRGFALGLAATGGASPGSGAVHGYGGVLLHPHVAKVGLLVSGMFGRGAGYDSMAGFGAISYLLGESGAAGFWALGGFGYYEETGILDESRNLALPTAGAMITYNLGGAQLIGAYTAMFGKFEEPGLSIDLRVYRGSIGVGWLVGGPRGMGS